MTAYATDPRVTANAVGGYEIACPGPHGGHVFQRQSGDWAARSGRREPGDFTGGFPTADEAIRSLIGEPQ